MTKYDFTVIHVVWLLGAVLAVFAGAHIEKQRMEKEIIKHGAAYYHPETGAFTWKDTKK